jgi:hypothetical protein
MTEEVWLASSPKGGTWYVQSMLDFLGSRLSRRKQVLLACNSFRLHRGPNPDEPSWALPAREVAELFVDGKATLEQLNLVRLAIEQELASDPYPNDVFHNNLPDMGTQALNLLGLAVGDIDSLRQGAPGQFYGQPFPFYDSELQPFLEAKLVRDVAGNPFRAVTLDPDLRTSDALALARSIYDDRAFERMPILADALQDAGCEDEDVLGHCRGPDPHVRGCWVVDLVLGKG